MYFITLSSSAFILSACFSQSACDLDEKRGAAGIAVRRLDDEVIAELGACRQCLEFGIGLGAPKCIGGAGDARGIADLGGDDLGIDALAQGDLGQGDLDAEVLGEPFGLLVEHDQQHVAGSARGDPVAHLLVLQQIVVDVFDGAELVRPVLARHGHLRVGAVEGIEIVDVLEAIDPAAEAQQVVGGRRHHPDRRLVLAEEGIDLRKAPERRLPGHVVIPSRHP
jgi:hypothetical protein